MLVIDGNRMEYDSISEQIPLDKLQSKIVKIMLSSEKTYPYKSIKHLAFELNLRKSSVDASLALYDSNIGFEVFRNARCNEQYWERTNPGGFLSKENVKPSDAMNDIYRNGYKYGTECSTAIVIIYYKAVLDVYNAALFDEIFPEIYLMNWIHIDSDLGITFDKDPIDDLPGDCIYFKNPDVDPETPEWRGENAIDLGNGYYYGHGMGIKTAEEILYILNRFRKEDAEQPAHRLDGVTRPAIQHLADIYINILQGTGV